MTAPMDHRWHPDELSARLEGRRRAGRSYVFRQGITRALDACRTRARPGQCWVDVGCGTGHLTAALADIGVRAVGLDVDPELIAFARSRFARSGEAAGPTFDVADATALPLGDGSVDGVVAVSLAGCLQRPRMFLVEVVRVLRPGGWLVVTFTSSRSLPQRCKTRMRRVLRRRPRAPHGGFRLYSADEVTAMAGDLGLRVDALLHYNYCMSVAGWLIPPAPVADLLQRLDRVGAAQRLANNLLLVAHRPESPGTAT